MATRRAQAVLVCVAAALLAWGMWRAVGRQEPAVKRFTTYVMVALVVVSAVNVFARKPAVAVACGGVCALFVVLVLLAAVLGAERGAPNRIPAIVRAVVFFLLIGVACVLQATTSPGSHE